MAFIELIIRLNNSLESRQMVQQTVKQSNSQTVKQSTKQKNYWAFY